MEMVHHNEMQVMLGLTTTCGTKQMKSPGPKRSECCIFSENAPRVEDQCHEFRPLVYQKIMLVYNWAIKILPTTRPNK